MKPHPHRGLSDLLLALRRKINEGAQRNQLKHELTMSQLEILWLVHTSGKKSMEGIAAYLGVRPPSITPLVHKLERAGLLLRRKDPADRRVAHVELTAKARRQLTALRRQKEAAFKAVTAKLSHRDRAELERILSILAEK